jgi:NAD(P)-dependent dehydrogenase (short-subunit alcohol dehydrogenase family)
LHLLAAGHRLAGVDTNGVGLDRLSASATTFGAKARLHTIVADLQLESACLHVVARATAHFGQIDVVINNAGIGMSSVRPDAEVRHPALEELSTEVWDRFFAINVRAPMLVTRAAAPSMKDRGWGRIVNNTTSFRTMLRVLPYGATKAALESMSAIWAKELNGTGITVNVLIPGGPTDTPFIADEAGWPRHEMLRPEIMAAPAGWLVSDESNAFTGQRITAARWNTAVPGIEAARGASRPIGWPELAGDAVWLEAK